MKCSLRYMFLNFLLRWLMRYRWRISVLSILTHRLGLRFKHIMMITRYEHAVELVERQIKRQQEQQ